MVNNQDRRPRLGLIQARKDLGCSQEELAERLGTSAVNVSRWENGATFPSPRFLKLLCKTLGKTAAELDLVQSSQSPPPPQPGRAWSIPIPHTPYFTGRDKLLISLHKRLTETKTAALTQPQALYGLGGIGKTRTAAEYVFRYGDKYAHVFWIHAETHDSLLTSFVALAQSLNLPQKDEQDQTRIVAAVRRWLADHKGWLLVMDNADDLPMAMEFLPTRHNGHILFTTRAQAAGTIATSVEVEKLTLREGTTLLLRWCNILRDDTSLTEAPAAARASAARIVREMDGLPLAIVQAGAFIQETGCSLADYLNLYTTHRKGLLARSSRLLPDHPETVATTWSLSFQQIEQQSPAAADLLRLLAFLAPDSIPEELLTRGAAAIDTPLATIADPLQFQETLGVLFRYSLIQRNANTHTLGIHRLVQTILKDSMDAQTQRVWAERTVLAVNAAFPDANSGAADPHYQSYIPHIQQCSTLIERHHLYSPESTRLLSQAGYFQSVHGFYPQAQLLHQQALTIREQVFGSADPAVAESLNALAILARARGDYEQAERLHQRALAIRKKSLGPCHPATAESLNNLGVLYLSQKNYEQAGTVLRQALSIREQSLGSEHPDTLIASINLAKLYIEKHTYEQARQLLNQALATGKRVLESGHPLIAHILNLLAVLSFEQGYYEQTETLWQQSLAIIKKSLGSDHPVAAERLNDLARLYVAQGRYREAQTLCQKAVSIYEERLGFEHPETIACQEHLNRILSKIEEDQDNFH